MHYPGLVCLLITSLSVLVLCFFLPYLTAGNRAAERAGNPFGTVIVATLLLAFALVRLRVGPVNPNQIMNSLTLTTVLLAGVGVKWLMETIAQKKLSIHESVLCRSLLAAPLAAILGSRFFATGNPTPTIFLLWFLNGYFWHTLFSDLERVLRREHVIIRRREPPTLPYDFRKPEID